MRAPLAAAFAVLLALPAFARADIPPLRPPSPPPPAPQVGATLAGLDSSVTTTGAPDHAMFEVHNPTGAAITLAISRLSLVATHDTTLRITGVQADGRAVNAAAVRIPPRATVHVVIFFSGIPAALAAAPGYDLVLAATLAGRSASASAHVARAHRDPIRRQDLVITS